MNWWLYNAMQASVFAAVVWFLQDSEVTVIRFMACVGWLLFAGVSAVHAYLDARYAKEKR